LNSRPANFAVFSKLKTIKSSQSPSIYLITLVQKFYITVLQFTWVQVDADKGEAKQI